MKYKDFYSYLINEGRNIDLAIQKLKKNGKENVFNELKEIDKSQNNKHLPKLVDYYLEIKDISILKSYYERFWDNTKLRSKDINSFKTFHDFENVIDAEEKKIENVAKNIEVDPIYEDDKIKVFHGDSKEKCIKLSSGYTFCIGRIDGSNLYNSYRFNKGSTFYFVRFKDKTSEISDNKYVDENHYIVIQQIHDRTLLLTHANNSGDEVIEKNKLIKKYPELKVLFDKEIIKPQEYSEKENIIKNKIADGDFDQMQSLSEREMWLEYHIGEKLLFDDFVNLPNELKKTYIETRGVDIPKKQLSWLKSNNQSLFKRYQKIKFNQVDQKLKNEIELTEHEIGSIFFFDKQLDYINLIPAVKYAYDVKNGHKSLFELPPYIIYNSIPAQIKDEYIIKTHFHGRDIYKYIDGVINTGDSTLDTDTIEHDMIFKYMSPEYAEYYLTKLIEIGKPMGSFNLKFLINNDLYSVLSYYLKKIFSSGKNLSKEEKHVFEIFSKKKIWNIYFQEVINAGRIIGDDDVLDFVRFCSSSSENMILSYLKKLTASGRILKVDQVSDLPTSDIAEKYATMVYEHGHDIIPITLFDWMTPEQRDSYAAKKIDKGLELRPYEFSGLPEELMRRYYENLLRKGERLPDNMFQWLPQSMKDEIVSKELNEDTLKYKDFYKHLLNEGMTIYVAGANDNRSVKDIYDLSARLEILCYRILESLPQDQKDYYSKNRPYELVTPDGNTNGNESNGVINLYYSGYTRDTLKKMLRTIMQELKNLKIKHGKFKVEKSGAFKYQVVRLPILDIGHIHNGPPEIEFSNRNAIHILKNILQFEPDDSTESGFSFSAKDLKERIEAILSGDPDWIKDNILHTHDSSISDKEQDLNKDHIPNNNIKGPRIINFGLDDIGIKDRLRRLLELANWAIKHGKDNIVAS